MKHEHCAERCEAVNAHATPDGARHFFDGIVTRHVIVPKSTADTGKPAATIRLDLIVEGESWDTIGIFAGSILQDPPSPST